MKIYLIDQSNKFPQHLQALKKASVMRYGKSELKEKVTFVTIDTSKQFSDLKTRFLFDYDIFPSNIMTYLTQWKHENRSMQVGDTIVQQAFIPPFRNLSQKIIFGVRINEIINEPTRIGFSYETLDGHVEKGISIFTVEQIDKMPIVFKVHTFSKPGNLLTQIIGPIFSVPYQTFCTRKGLSNVKQQLEGLQTSLPACNPR
jgi:hypothetical protein